MSYSLIPMIIVAILAIFTPFIAYLAFKKGYELGVKDWNIARPEQPKVMPERKAKVPSAISDKELKKYEDLLANIENYDGTSAHQKEIM